MKKYDKILSFVFPLGLFLVSWSLRTYFFAGFILCDDKEVFIKLKLLLTDPIDINNQIDLRFGIWMFNWIVFKWLGVSEFSFFLPTILMSASLCVIGYFLLVFLNYKRFQAFLAGLVIASAPFEILMGTVRANDLIFSWMLAIGLALFVFLEKKPILQGISTTLFLWLSFYVKLWVVYLLPALSIYYLIQIARKNWKGVLSFTLFSSILHGTTWVIFKYTTGYFMPFIHIHASTYPVAVRDLPYLFLIYPKYIFSRK